MPNFEAAPAIPEGEKRNTIRNPFLTPEVIERHHKAAARFGSDFYQALEEATPREVPSNRTGKPETYYPSLMGKGGEHVVFEFDDPKHKGVVFKVNFDQTKKVFLAGFRGPSQQKAAISYMREDMADQQERLAELRKYFGHGTVPVQRLAIRDVPLTHDIVKTFDPRFEDFKGKLPDHVPAWVVVQRRLELPPHGTVSLNGYYAEPTLAESSEKRRNTEEHIYDDAHDVLVGYQEAGSVPLGHDAQVDRILDLFPSLSPVAQRVEEDEAFKQELKEVVRQLIAYTRDTGNAMDLNGQNNLVMIRKDGKWQLKMPDPLFSGEQPQMSDLAEAAKALSQDESISEGLVGRAYNPLNTLRVINALAIIAGIPDRLDVEGMAEISPRRWRKNLLPLLARR